VVSIKQFACLVFGGLVVLLTGTRANAQSTCTRSDTLPTGTSPTWYVSVASSEHADSQRTQVFGRTCTLTEVTQSKRLRIRVRQAPGTYPAIYNVVTRNRNELYVFGGNAGQSSGAYVARLDPETLVELWRTPLRVSAGQWSYLGVMAVHGNGFLYAVTSNLLVKLNPTTGAILASLALPQLPADKGGTGAAYNGFVVTADGLIVTKSIERGPCTADGPQGLFCAIDNRLPSTLAVVDPGTLRLLAATTLSEPSLGRLMSEKHDGIDYIYIPGVSALTRYTWVNNTLALDSGWGPVGYDGGTSPSGLGLLGSFVVGQTNIVPSVTPTRVFAVNIFDGSQVYHLQPFVGLSSSWVPSKGVFDTVNSRLYVQDTAAAQVAAIDLTPTGLQLAWKVENRATGFMALLGPSSARQISMPAFSA